VDAYRDIIVIGASLGGIEALRVLVGGLPEDLPAAVFIVQHLAPESPSVLAHVLSRSAAVPISTAGNDEPIDRGRVVVAPPDHHLILQPGRMRIVRGPNENRHRPAVDPLFRSAAASYGPRVIGVLLTGALDDGVAGLGAIKAAGGLAMVQDPDDCVAPSMPRSAIERVAVDRVLPVAELAEALVQTARSPVGMPLGDPPSDVETRLATGERVSTTEVDKLGSVSVFTCPDCHGPLWEIPDGAGLRYRCYLGHAFSQVHLEAAQAQQRERALWIALHAVQEQAEWYRRLAKRFQDSGLPALSPRFEDKAAARDRDAQVIRAMIEPASGFPN
jgi:two-component system, chemotaxis family, protein-glutamate methylesterase/glutaminase